MQFRVRENTEQRPNHLPRSCEDTARPPIGERNRLRHGRDNIAHPAARNTKRPETILKWVLTRLLPVNSANEPEYDSDLEKVEAAAEVGEISEYDLFQAAWLAWYGTTADSLKTEQLFGAYLNGAPLPGHVRHFVRRLLSAANDPALDFDRELYGLGKFRRKEPLIRF